MQGKTNAQRYPGLFAHGKGWRFWGPDPSHPKGRRFVTPAIDGVKITNQAEAYAWMMHWLHGNKDDRPPTPDKITFGELVEVVLELNPRRNKASTLRTKRNNLAYLTGISDMRVQLISWEDLVVKVIKPMEDRGIAPNTIHNVLSLVSTVFRHAMKRKIRRDNPVHLLDAGEDKPIRDKVRETRVVTPEEFGKLLTIRHTMPHFKVAFALMGLAGLRPSEALGHQWPDVDFTTNRIFVREQLVRTENRKAVGADRDAPKTRGSVGWVQMQPELAQILRVEWMRRGRPAEGYVVQNRRKPVQHSTLRDSFMRAAKRAGLAEPLPTPHCLRHMYTSALMRHVGVGPGLIPFATIASQTRNSVATMVGTYTHEAEADLAGVGAALDSAFGDVLRAGRGQGVS